MRITLVLGAAAIAVAEREEPSITAISPKNSPLPRVTMMALAAPLTLALAVEHHEHLAPGRAFLENDIIHIKFVDALFDRHGNACLLAGSPGMLVGKRGGANDASGRSAPY